MASYIEIQEYVKGKTGNSIKSCWIAHMKEICGLPVKQAPNRKDINKREKPCPDDKQEIIREAFEYFGML